MRETQLVPLRAAVQNYAWGNPGSTSLVAHIHEKNALAVTDAVKPYAELWIGTHPSGPAYVLDDPGARSLTLAEYLSSSSVQIPYLLKILSVSKALSIQAHPDKALAERLHAERPDAYKDDNHKPEMSVALTPFEAMCNFRPVVDILRDLDTLQPLASLIGKDAHNRLSTAATAPPQERKAALRLVFETLIRKSPDQIAKPLLELVASTAAKESSARSPQELLFLKLVDQYPGDIGCFSAFLLNYIHLEEGEAFFMAANEPHAYLSGQCVEIMACSDNVVRAGLTPKFKDVDTLVEMLTYEEGPPEVSTGIKVNDYIKVFQPPVSEFQLERIEIPAGRSCDMPQASGPGILLVIAGEGTVVCDSTKRPLSPGTIYYTSPCAKFALASVSETKVPLLLFRAGVSELSGPVLETTATPLTD